MTKDIAIEILTDLQDGNASTYWYRENVIGALDMAITALKADRPRGEWEKATESIWKCSLCNAIMFTDSNYCPNCGAKMGRERSKE